MGLPKPNSPPYCPDGRFSVMGAMGNTIPSHAYMMGGIAKQLMPIFLISHQFNEFATGPTRGSDADTNDEIEPRIYGETIDDVKAEIEAYRTDSANGRCWAPIRLRLLCPTGTGVSQS